MPPATCALVAALRLFRGHFRIAEMASDIGEYEGMSPEGTSFGAYPLIL